MVELRQLQCYIPKLNFYGGYALYADGLQELLCSSGSLGIFSDNLGNAQASLTENDGFTNKLQVGNRERLNLLFCRERTLHLFIFTITQKAFQSFGNLFKGWILCEESRRILSEAREEDQRITLSSISLCRSIVRGVPGELAEMFGSDDESPSTSRVTAS